MRILGAHTDCSGDGNDDGVNNIGDILGKEGLETGAGGAGTDEEGGQAYPGH